jgi:hypothetical protein
VLLRTFLQTRARIASIIATALVFGLVAPIVSTTAHAAPSCPTMQIVGVRGSGETADDAGGYGTTVRSVVDAIRSVNPTAAAVPIDYPAIAVRWWDPTYYTGNYTKSVRAGRTALANYITQFLSSSCGTSTYLYLVGFSQGAQVVGDVYQNLPFGQRSRVKGVTMIADPKFHGLEGSPVNVGTYEFLRNGIQDVTTIFRRIPNAQEPYVRSYCSFGDPVCNFGKTNVALCVASLSECIHLHYMDLREPKSGLAYTTLAADYLLDQWRKFGPKPPQVGPRSNILVFGNADTEESSTGVSNLTSALTSAGYTVTYSTTLPDDLSQYGQVWWYGIDALTDSQQAALTDYARAGGSLYLTGEWFGCCNSPTNDEIVANIFNGLVVTVGGLQFGPDSPSNTVDVNSAALQGADEIPNALSTFTGGALGSMSTSNIGDDHFLATDSNGNGTIGLWDNTDVVGGGRLAIVMDVNWAQTEFGDMTTMPRVAQNIAYFLSGATSPNTLQGTFVPATPTQHRIDSSQTTGQRTAAAKK